MVEVKNKFELITAVMVDKEDEILVRDPDLIEYLVKECDIKPKLPENPSSDTGLCSCRYYTDLSIEDIIKLLEAIPAIISAIGVIIALVLGFLSIKDALKKGYNIEIKFNPKTGKIESIEFKRPKSEGPKPEGI